MRYDKEREKPGKPSSGSRSPRKGSEPNKKVGALQSVIGQRVTIQGKSGIIYSGLLVELSEGFLRLEDCMMQGNNFRVQPPWCLIDRTSISHVHPSVDIERIGDGSEW
jgi:hypothetical protein